MGRLIWTILGCVAVGLGLCVSAAWLRSYLIGDWVYWRVHAAPTYHVLEVRSGWGVVMVKWERQTLSLPQGVNDLGSHWSTPGLSHAYSERSRGFVPTGLFALDFDYRAWSAPRSSYRSITIVVPYWFLLLGVIILVRLWVVSGRRLRRKIRQQRGLCGRCGYDLRATRQSCPECGERVKKRGAGKVDIRN